MSEAAAKAFITDETGSTSAADVRDAIGTIYTDLSGGSSVVSAIGDKSADRTTASTSLVDLTDMSVAIAAAAGDRLEISFNCVATNNTDNAFDLFAGNISGTGVIDPACAQTITPAGSGFVVPLLTYHVVQAGDISGGNVTVKIQWRVNTGTGTVVNENTLNRAPIMVVKNYGQ